MSLLDNPKININNSVPPASIRNQWPVSPFLNMRIRIALLLLIFFLCYLSTLAALIQSWWNSISDSHGFFVIPVSLYLVWMKRGYLRSIHVSPNLSGGISTMVLAGIMLILGHLSGIIILEELSLVVMIAGIILLMLGWDHLKALALPITYLLFMISFVDLAPESIYWPLQLFAAHIGVSFLHFLGISAYLDNQYIELPHITLEVARECSGLRYLISILATGIPLAYLTLEGWKKRVGLVAAAVIIAILANGIRVTLVGINAYHGNLEQLHGPYHFFNGMFIAWIGLIVLFTGAWILSERSSNLRKEKDAYKRPIRDFEVSLEHNAKPWMIAILFLLILASFLFFYGVTPIPASEELKSIPFVLEDWTGHQGSTTENPVKVPLADYEIARVYRNRAGHQVNFYLSYFESQIHGKSLINYITKKIHQNGTEMEFLLPDHSRIQVNKVIWTEGKETYLVLFWYEIHKKKVTNWYEAKLLTLYDSILHRHSNGSLIVFASLINPDLELSNAIQDEKALIGALTSSKRNTECFSC